MAVGVGENEAICLAGVELHRKGAVKSVALGVVRGSIRLREFENKEEVAGSVSIGGSLEDYTQSDVEKTAVRALVSLYRDQPETEGSFPGELPPPEDDYEGPPGKKNSTMVIARNPMKMKRGEALCKAAIDLINGERQDRYGDPEDSFTLIAERWTQYLKARYHLDYTLEAEDVALMMTDLKIAREIVQNKRDNTIDAVGYLGCRDTMLHPGKGGEDHG